MFYKSKLLRDTAILTIFQLILDSASLLLNAFITRQLGAQAIGILSLIGSFLGLAGILSNGNAFLCTSRLVAEETGKGGAPDCVLFHGIKLCLCLSTAVSAAILLLSEPICRRFFSGADMGSALRIMPAVLVTGAVGACIKGYFNACRRTRVTAVGDVIEFAVRSAVIAVLTMKLKAPDEAAVCRVMISGIVAGNVISLAYLSVMYLKLRTHSSGKPSIGFRKYAACAFPIMGGGVLTAVLSSTNDALIPFCLRQYGDSAGQALGSFGVFEAIVIPTLFFPSVILCSVSGIILSESARAAASGDKRRIKSLASRITEYTLIYAVFSAAVLMRFGSEIGVLLGGGNEAGRLITVIAPVVPFIYMEIVLEAMIKGMGLQSFSSLNYLAEYAVRIAVVLIFVPRYGLYGIVASYYTSNVFGNCSRFVRLIRASEIKFRPVFTMIMPVVYVFLSMGASDIIIKPFFYESGSIPYMAVFTAVWGIIYCGILMLIGRIRLFDKCKEEFVVESA
ncbi:MAG: polysaccharide biosynthesis protein [Ruminococcus sp.]|nr:polysaccharide biosynthesis protein [Ruminococcus sp.]